MTTNFSRRNFLKGTAAAGATLSLQSFSTQAAEGISALVGAKAPAYNSWEDIYRQQWTWDKIVRSTHVVNCWYQNNCAWDVYVKDGIVFREEQAGEYPQINSKLPDQNPRGCQKGCHMSRRLYDPSRLLYPLRRVGPRGGGRWERISWDEALDAIADQYLDIVVKEGTDRVIWDVGPTADWGGTASSAALRFSKLTRSVILELNTEIGDGHRGSAEALGKIIGSGSMDDYFYSDLVLMWGCNPFYTQIPNSHFLTEARYNGTKIITITPDYNPSSVHSDLWIPVKAGSDAALALSVAHLLIEEGKINKPFVQEQTDLPLLVRADTGRFLMESDIKEGGSKERFLLVDEVDGKIKQSPWKDLKLDGISPALEVKKQIQLADGKRVEVRTVYSMLRARLKDYTPEKASKHCGTSPKMIRRLADEIAKAKAMANVVSTNLSKYYHGNLMERSMILVFALTGQFGHKGSGWQSFPLVEPDAMDTFPLLTREKDAEALEKDMAGMLAAGHAAGMTKEESIYSAVNKGAWQPGAPFPQMTCATAFWQVHGGILELSKDAQNWDPFLKKPIADYLDEAIKNKNVPLMPAAGQDPRMFIAMSSNTLRRLRGAKQARKTLWPKFKTVVVLDFRMTTTTRHADYVLPAATAYERDTHRGETLLNPYFHLVQQVVPPLGESKNDWAIITLLAKHIQKRAKARGIGTIVNAYGEKVNLGGLYDDFTIDGQYTEHDEKKVMKKMVDMSANIGATWEQIEEKGFARFTSIGNLPLTIGNMCDIPKDDSITHYTWHTHDKIPWPTTTRRIQFYIDHPLYFEFDEALPRHKDAPTNGGKYPLTMTGGHCRESIHSTWRDSKLMLQLTRGEAFILVSPIDAATRKVKDNDWIRCYNDTGEFVARAKLTPAMKPGLTLIYHAWEDYQFAKGSINDVTPTPLNPVEFSGDYPHLKPVMFWGVPAFFDRETRIDIEPWVKPVAKA